MRVQKFRTSKPGKRPRVAYKVKHGAAPTYCRVVIMGVIVSRPMKRQKLQRLRNWAEIVVRVSRDAAAPVADIPVLVIGRDMIDLMIAEGRRGRCVQLEGDLRNNGVLTLGDGALKRAQRGVYVVTSKVQFVDPDAGKGRYDDVMRMKPALTDEVLALRTDLPF